MTPTYELINTCVTFLRNKFLLMSMVEMERNYKQSFGLFMIVDLLNESYYLGALYLPTWHAGTRGVAGTVPHDTHKC